MVDFNHRVYAYYFSIKTPIHTQSIFDCMLIVDYISTAVVFVLVVPVFSFIRDSLRFGASFCFSGLAFFSLVSSTLVVDL